jgi:SnoaL-like polyketide cyclase
MKKRKMKEVIKSIGAVAVSLVIATTVNFSSCANQLQSNAISRKGSANQEEIDSLRIKIKELRTANEMIAKNLATFDTLDYTVISNQEWARLHESHSKDVKVYWPDGYMTQGIDVHIEDLKKLFVYASDTRIKQHLIQFGSGNYTAVIGVFEGSFTKPMPVGDGKFIQPTGKAFKIPMATIGIWENGVMVEEHLFSDRQTYANQIGLGK